MGVGGDPDACFGVAEQLVVGQADETDISSEPGLVLAAAASDPEIAVTSLAVACSWV